MESYKEMPDQKKATREALGKALIDLQDDSRLVVLSADLKKPTNVESFSKSCPEKYIECGIAEANMIGISAGLAQGGFQPICTSFASFLTGRYDIIRVSIGYQNLPVVLVGTHSGLAIGKDGVTQMGLEDISLMRAMPNMQVLNPSTFNQAYTIIKGLINSERSNPYYLRLGRQPVNENYSENDTNTSQGFSVIGNGKDVAICSTGCVLDEVIKAKESLKEQSINAQIIDIYKLDKTINNDLKDVLRMHHSIITVEDHSITGGLGSFLSESVVENDLNIKIQRIGVKNIFPQSGAPTDLYNRYGINHKNIVKKCQEILKRK